MTVCFLFRNCLLSFAVHGVNFIQRLTLPTRQKKDRNVPSNSWKNNYFMISCRVRKISIVVQNLNYNEAGTASVTNTLPGQ